MVAMSKVGELYGDHSLDFRDATLHTPTVMPQKPTRPTPSAKNEKDEYGAFENALKRVLKVSHTEMQKRITRASAGRGSNSKA